MSDAGKIIVCFWVKTITEQLIDVGATERTGRQANAMHHNKIHGHTGRALIMIRRRAMAGLIDPVVCQSKQVAIRCFNTGSVSTVLSCLQAVAPCSRMRRKSPITDSSARSNNGLPSTTRISPASTACARAMPEYSASRIPRALMKTSLVP